jgi:hypothetical protein
MVEKNDSGNHTTNASNQGGGEIEAVPPGQSPPNPNDECRRQNGYFQKPENWVALATLTAVVVYTGITALIWCTNNRQLAAVIESNKISNASFISAQRAYMYFSGINTRKT